jgi:hypothetical protein
VDKEPKAIEWGGVSRFMAGVVEDEQHRRHDEERLFTQDEQHQFDHQNLFQFAVEYTGSHFLSKN